MDENEQTEKTSTYQQPVDEEPKKSMVKPIVAGIALVLAIGAVGYWFLAKPASPETANIPEVIQPQPTPLPRAQMWFTSDETPASEPADTNMNMVSGVQKTFTIVVDAGNRVINGADAVVQYDPAFFSIVSVQAAQSAQEAFTVIPRVVEEEGTIVVTAFKNEYNEVPTERFMLATITLRALKSGTSALEFEFNPGATTGSTVIQARDNENILDQVYSSAVTIQ